MVENSDDNMVLWFYGQKTTNRKTWSYGSMVKKTPIENMVLWSYGQKTTNRKIWSYGSMVEKTQMIIW